MLNKTSKLIVFIFFLIGNCSGVEKVYRAYIPREGVKLFNLLVKNNPDIDVWLYVRIDDHRNRTTFEQHENQIIVDHIGKYKYYSEFKARNSNIIESRRSEFESYNIRVDVMIDDLKKHMCRHKIPKSQATKRSIDLSPSKSIVGKYVGFNDIVSWMNELGKTYPDLVQIYKIGKTFEKRPIMLLKMTDSVRSRATSKPLFLFDGGIHAREWVSITTVVYLIDRLIKEYRKSNEMVVKLLNKFELHFIPVLNPDGFEFSRASKYNRFWRKNLRYLKKQSTDNSCYGVDLNRNFDYKWMVSGASANPCSEVFAGSYPGSEPEISSLMRYITGKSPRWLSHISLHSYGAIWLSPFSYSKHHMAENFEETCQKANMAIRKIKKMHKFEYRFGCASFELYEAGGCSEDWSKEVAKINHTFVIELKPEKSDIPESGFEMPENELQQTGLEIYDGFIEYINSFLVSKVDPDIVEECKLTKTYMIEDLKEIQDENQLEFK